MNKDQSKEVTKKAFGTSWTTTIILAVIVGIIGALICQDKPLIGFLAGVVLTIVTEFTMLAGFIPFAGPYLYWIWTSAFYQWFLGIVFGVGTANYANMLTLTLLPLIVFAIFAVILCIVSSLIVIVLVGTVIAAIFG
jgi:hypothetical protein